MLSSKSMSRISDGSFAWRACERFVRSNVRVRQHESLQRVEMKVPTFDGHLNQSNTDWRRWFDAIHTAQEIDSGIQA